jgi:hypothetical protein
MVKYLSSQFVGPRPSFDVKDRTGREGGVVHGLQSARSSNYDYPTRPYHAAHLHNH